MTTNTAGEQAVVTERRGPALWIIINREERRNALNPFVVAGIEQGLHEAARTPGVRAVVITGQGDKAFCAGADLTRGTGVFTEGLNEPTTDFGRLARVAHGFGLPLIARINGACVAGGMGIMALCDMAIAADHARFGLPEGKVGVFPMQVMAYLRHHIAPRHANALCFTGELIGAAKAYEIGLVNEVVPGAQLDAAVERMVGQIAALSPVAIRRGKYAIANMQDMAFHEALSFAETQIAVASNTADAREGLAAFNEKRPPAWAVQEKP